VKLVLVEWEDPASTGGWLDWEEAVQNAVSHNRTCRTVGWVVYEDESLIVIAGSVGCADPPQIGDVFEIPRRVIDRLVELKEIGLSAVA
jgi:hypothetical protein